MFKLTMGFSTIEELQTFVGGGNDLQFTHGKLEESITDDISPLNIQDSIAAMTQKASNPSETIEVQSDRPIAMSSNLMTQQMVSEGAQVPLVPEKVVDSYGDEVDIRTHGSIEVDAEGTPWDERIHAGTKTMSVKNIWKKKRGVDDEVFIAVMAELQGGGINHSQLLDRIISEFAEGNLSVFTVGDVVTELGISSLNDASGNPELIEAIAERLGVE